MAKGRWRSWGGWRTPRVKPGTGRRLRQGQVLSTDGDFHDAREHAATLTYARRNEDLEVDFILEARDRVVAIEVTSARRVRPRKVDRLVRTGAIIDADTLVLVHGGVPEDLGDEVLSLPLPIFLLDPSCVLGDS